MQRELSNLALSSFSITPAVLESILSISYLPVNARKTLNTLCQNQIGPRSNTRTYQRLSAALHREYDTPSIGSSEPKPRSLLDIAFSLQPLIESSYLSGFLSMLLRNIGYEDYTSVKDVFEATVTKEITAAVDVYRPCVLRWDCLLHPLKRVRSKTSVASSRVQDFFTL